MKRINTVHDSCLQPQFPRRDERIVPLQMLRPSGELVDGCVSAMDEEQVLQALHLMMLSRAFDSKGVSLQRQGRFGTFSPVRGQEASVVGSAFALNPTQDWIVPQYRELPALLHHGLPLEQFILYFSGHPAGGHIPDRRSAPAHSDLHSSAIAARGRPRVGFEIARCRLGRVGLLWGWCIVRRRFS